MTHILPRLALFLAWLLAPADLTQAELWNRAEAARTPEEVAALEPALAKLDAHWRAFRAMDVSSAWLRMRRFDDALRVLDENRKAARADEVVVVDEHKVRVLRAAGRSDDAIAEARRVLAEIAKDPKSSSWNERVANGLHRELAGIFQRLGRFREALAEHALWHSDSHCGTCDGEDDAEKSLDIARCRLGLGETDAALDGFFAVATGAWRSGSDGAALFVEHSARAGRLDAARKRIARLDDDPRRRFELPLRITDAWTARDPAALLAAASAGFDAEQRQARRWDGFRMAASFLRDLGRPGEERLVAQIRSGDLSAAFLSAVGPFPAALPAVTSRRDAAKEPAEREFLDWVVKSIEAAARK